MGYIIELWKNSQYGSLMFIALMIYILAMADYSGLFKLKTK